MIFCDTSTLAKYYVPEAESEAVRSRLDGEDEVVLSELARAELMGVFHRRMRERKWTRREFSAFVRQFGHDHIRGYWTWVPLDGGMVSQAVQIYATLPDTVFLRASDCIHLATALHRGFAEIHTHDKHQLRAAATLGLDAIRIAAD